MWLYSTHSACSCVCVEACCSCVGSMWYVQKGCTVWVQVGKVCVCVWDEHVVCLCERAGCVCAPAHGLLWTCIIRAGWGFFKKTGFCWKMTTCQS